MFVIVYGSNFAKSNPINLDMRKKSYICRCMTNKDFSRRLWNSVAAVIVVMLFGVVLHSVSAYLQAVVLGQIATENLAWVISWLHSIAESLS